MEVKAIRELVAKTLSALSIPPARLRHFGGC